MVVAADRQDRCGRDDSEFSLVLVMHTAVVARRLFQRHIFDGSGHSCKASDTGTCGNLIDLLLALCIQRLNTGLIYASSGGALRARCH